LENEDEDVDGIFGAIARREEEDDILEIELSSGCSAVRAFVA
jgi:hypothetical protein